MYKSQDVLGEYIEDEQHRDVFGTADHVALFTGSVTCHCSIRYDSHVLFVQAALILGGMSTDGQKLTKELLAFNLSSFIATFQE